MHGCGICNWDACKKGQGAESNALPDTGFTFNDSKSSNPAPSTAALDFGLNLSRDPGSGRLCQGSSADSGVVFLGPKFKVGEQAFLYNPETFTRASFCLDVTVKNVIPGYFGQETLYDVGHTQLVPERGLQKKTDSFGVPMNKGMLFG